MDKIKAPKRMTLQPLKGHLAMVGQRKPAMPHFHSQSLQEEGAKETRMEITTPTIMEREMARVPTPQWALVLQEELSLANLLEAYAIVTKIVLGQLCHEMSVAFLSILQAIEPATNQVDSIGPENTSLMDPKFIAVKR